jgi:hypothetical protein
LASGLKLIYEVSTVKNVTHLQSHINFASPSMVVMEITPEMARAWLKTNVGNRPARQAHVKALQKAIANGEWKLTGDPIRFSASGKLIDGQHRLQAIVNSGITVQAVVMHGLQDDIFDVIDSGKGRSRSDLLCIDVGLPVETGKILGTAVGIAYDYEKGNFSFRGSVSSRELMDYVHRNPSLIASSEYAQRLPRSGTPVPRSIAAAFHFFASKLDQEAAEAFLTRLMVGVVNGQNDMLLHMRNLCSAALVARRPISTPEIMARLIKIWNAEQRGKPIGYFSNTKPRQGENFPQFI